MQTEKKIWFRNLCVKNGLMPTDLQLDQLDQYVNQLLDWNKKINLLSRKDEENIWTFHLLHCASLLFKIKLKEGSKIVDIGTGGGLPGVPMKILRPDISVLCIDATRKKANAVSEMVGDLKLDGIKILWGRAEEIGIQDGYMENFDFAVARAVAPLNELIFWSKNFLRKETTSDSVVNIVNDGRIVLNSPALEQVEQRTLRQIEKTASSLFGYFMNI